MRVEALLSVGNRRQKESIPFLIARLPEERGRQLQDVAAVLRLFSGLDLGTKPEPWRRWWNEEGSSKPLPSYEVALAAERARFERRAANESQATFYGLEIASDHVTFVLDVSGSMQNPARGRGSRSDKAPPRGTTRMQVAENELVQALRTFAVGDWFNLIFFEGSVHAWLDEETEMDEEARADGVGGEELVGDLSGDGEGGAVNGVVAGIGFVVEGQV